MSQTFLTFVTFIPKWVGIPQETTGFTNGLSILTHCMLGNFSISFGCQRILLKTRTALLNLDQWFKRCHLKIFLIAFFKPQ